MHHGCPGVGVPLVEVEQGSTRGTHLGAQGPAWALPRQDW